MERRREKEDRNVWNQQRNESQMEGSWAGSLEVVVVLDVVVVIDVLVVDQHGRCLAHIELGNMGQRVYCGEGCGGCGDGGPC